MFVFGAFHWFGFSISHMPPQKRITQSYVARVANKENSIPIQHNGHTALANIRAMVTTDRAQEHERET